ncbi:MAG: cytochrome c peroxidase, partial [Saprospiraceae bacterium]
MNLKRFILLSMLSMLVLLSACRKDDDNIPSTTDEQLTDALMAASNGVGNFHYILPSSTDFNTIPQDPKNPLTTEKVALGKLLYHETGLAISPMMSQSA